MTKSVTVNFNDGTSHVYDNVPDDVTNDEVHERASKDYPDQQIVGFEHNTAAPLPPPSPQPSAMGQAVGGAQTAFNATNQMLNSPLGHLIEGIGGGAYGLKKLGDIASKYASVRNASNAPTTAPAPTPTPTPTTAPTPNYSNATPSPTPTMTQPTPGEPVFNRMNAQLQNMGQRMPSDIGQVRPGGVPTQAPSIRPIELPPGHPMLNPQSAPSTSNYLQRMAQLAAQYAPAAANAARIGGVGLAGMLPATLNSNEDQLLAQKHALEQAQLLNKQRTEVNSKQKQPQ